MSNLLVQNIKHTNGTTAQTFDSSGRILTSARPSFRAHLAANGAWTDITHGGNYAVVFDAEKYDVGGNFDTSTGRFTVPITGTYYFAARCYLHENQGTRWLTIAKGTTNPAAGETANFLAQWYDSTNTTGRNGIRQVDCTVQLAAGDQVGVYLYQDSDSANGVYSENNTVFNSFEGHLIG